MWRLDFTPIFCFFVFSHVRKSRVFLASNAYNDRSIIFLNKPEIVLSKCHPIYGRHRYVVCFLRFSILINRVSFRPLLALCSRCGPSLYQRKLQCINAQLNEKQIFRLMVNFQCYRNEIKLTRSRHF